MKIAGFKNISKLWGKFHWDNGIRTVGDSYFRADSINDPRLVDVDCFYQFNVYNKYNKTRDDRIDTFNYIINSGKPVVVREEGCFRQFPEYKTFGWNHYHRNKGNFNNEHISDNLRWNKFVKDTGIRFNDWRSIGDSILILGQVELDSALIPLYDEGYKSVDEWIINTIKEIRKYSDRPIIVRPHPLTTKGLYKIEDKLNNKYKNITISKNYNQTTTLNGGAGLYADLNSAYCAISYNSNSLVEAAAHGLPIFALNEEAMSYDIAHHNLSQLENLNYNIDITNWCNKVVYTIWKGEEVETGETWSHLKPVYFK